MKFEQLQTLHGSSRLFVYTSTAELSKDYAADFSLRLDHFIPTWEAHGVKLNASYVLIANRMLIIAVDERSQTATGCSIDKLTHLLKSESVDWFDRMHIHYKENGTWQTLHMMDLASKVKSGEISEDIEILNSTVLTLQDLDENLVQTLKKSWLNNLL